MRFLRPIALFLALSLLLCGCGAATNISQNNPPQSEQAGENLQKNETIGVWITYSEIDAMVKSEQGFEGEFAAALDLLKTVGVNTVYFHTVAFCDAVYSSEIYPSRHGTDLLGAALKIAKDRGISLHAWLNPYRVQTASTDIKQLPEGFAKQWLEKGYSNDICVTASGIYLNPASERARGKIIGAVREILADYAVDGIHFDDYFYPTTSPDFDSEGYKLYRQNAGAEPLTLEEWRRHNVTALILGVRAVVRAEGNALFGISPAADLSRNYNELFADIEGFVNAGYIDYIIPQLYFGFEYPNEQFCFQNLLLKWLDIKGDNPLALYIGLGVYKSGTKAEPDRTEWQANGDIIARQIELLRKNGVEGFCYFSYSSLFSDEPANREQLKNIKDVINE